MSTGTLKPPLAVRLADPETDRVVRNHREKLAELQNLPASGMRVIAGVELPDATDTPIPHSLGRKPVGVWVSAPRSKTSAAPSSTGRIVEAPSSTYDPAKFIVLHAEGWGMTVVVSLQVW